VPHNIIEMLIHKIKQLKVISVGHITHDLLSDYSSDHSIVGGSSFYGGKVASGLGAEVHLCAAVGEDFKFDNDLYGMQLHLIKSQYTTVFYNFYPLHQARVQWLIHRSSNIRPQDFINKLNHSRKIKPSPPTNTLHTKQIVKQVVSSTYPSIYQDQDPLSSSMSDLLFLAPVIDEINPHDQWPQLLRSRLCVLCLQGLLRKTITETDQALLNSNHFQYSLSHISKTIPQRVIASLTNLPVEFLKDIDVLFLSDEDLASTKSDMILDFLRQHVKLIFLTHGEHGCSIYQEHHIEPYHIGTYPTHVIDPTGAGDTFAMATSLALLSGVSAQHAAYFGTAAASIVIEATGSKALSSIQKVFPRFQALLDQTKNS
jgi:hypothetical protein